MPRRRSRTCTACRSSRRRSGRSNRICATRCCASPAARTTARSMNVVIAAGVNLHGDPMLAAAQAAREAGNAPNAVLAAACSIYGPKRVAAARKATDTLIDLFAHSGLQDAHDESFDFSKISGKEKALFTGAQPDLKAEAMLAALAARKRKVGLCPLPALPAAGHRRAMQCSRAICATLAWGPLMRKRISRETVRGLPWYVGLWGTLIGASVDAARHEPYRFCGISDEELLASWSATELAYLTLIGERARPEQLFAFRVLTGLLISNAVGQHFRAGLQGRGVLGRAGNARPRADQQGDGRFPHAHRLFARRRRLRGHHFSGRAVPRLRADGPRERVARPRPEDHGEDVRRAVRARENSAQGVRAPSACARSPASTIRCSATSR